MSEQIGFLAVAPASRRRFYGFLIPARCKNAGKTPAPRKNLILLANRMLYHAPALVVVRNSG
jgi:hypothetical protein